MREVEHAKTRIRQVVARSQIPEDPRHADNTLEWLLRFEPTADHALEIAALAHDIDRADEHTKIRRADYDTYDTFKAAHARHSAQILDSILTECRVPTRIAVEACRLVEIHEIGGDARADLVKDADSISYFDVNLPLYYQREGWTETKRRSSWGYERLSTHAKQALDNATYPQKVLNRLLQQVIHGDERQVDERGTEGSGVLGD